MKHSGKARKAAFKLILITLVAGAVLWGVVAFAAVVGTIVSAVALPVLVILWIVFSIFTLYFFRDPNPRVPTGANLIISPAHAKVDVIDTTTEPTFLGGECKRISMFLSVFDVHVQNAPAAGKVALVRYSVGQFLNALRTESATYNENVLLGFELDQPPGQKIAVRLIAGVIARRIVPFVAAGDPVKCGDRISLIQFGSRADVYLPLSAKIQVKLGDKVVGGQTVIASLE
jgi:phosphatidylserine decarboxylase